MQYSGIVLAVLVALFCASCTSAQNRPCTTVDHTVQNVPADLRCLEDFVRSPTSTCPAASKKRTNIPREIFPNCPGREGYVAATTSAREDLCVIHNGPSPTYTDQPRIGANTAAAGNITATQALRNAKPAMDQRLWYSQCGRANYHRIDCVGLVTRAWNLNINAAYTTGDLKADRLTNSINCQDMQPGDILVNKPHVMMFHSWVNKPLTFRAWQAAAPNMGHIENTETLQALITRTGDNQYHCRRYKHMQVATSTAGPAAVPLPTPAPAAADATHVATPLPPPIPPGALNPAPAPANANPGKPRQPGSGLAKPYDNR